MENIWLFLRENWLSNMIFRSYDQILELSCEAWNKLTAQPSTIMAIGTRNWAHVSRQIAALEDEIGVAPFERSSTGADVDRVRETVVSVVHGTVGRLRLAVCEDATIPTFAAILADGVGFEPTRGC